jgi:WD40 repeat protein
MTTDDRFSRTLSDWLRESAEHRVPDHLGEVLVQTAATSQRAWWSSPERWLPVDTVAPSRAAPVRPMLFLALIGALLIALVGVVVIGTPGPSQDLIPFGTAQNGRVFVSTGTSVRSYAPDGSDERLVRTVPEGAGNLAIAPDGRHLAIVVAAQRAGGEIGRIDILDLDTGSVVEVAAAAGWGTGDQIAWAPDSRQIMFPGFAGDLEAMFIAQTADGRVEELAADLIDHDTAVGWADWSPDGEWIAFAAVDRSSFVGPIYRIRPDGTDLDEIAPDASVGDRGGLRWSPDPAVQRLLFLSGQDLVLWDAADDSTMTLDEGFWPSWSPDGKRVGFWTGGPVVADLADAPWTPDELEARFTGFLENCQDNADLAGKTICSPSIWSPEGDFLVGPNVVGGGAVIASALEPGGGPIVVAGDLPVNGIAWQPVAP